jgi:electron-transferring-flavoprotein dehydrogenase
MTEIQRETLEVDVLFVGAGPACLAGAIRMGRILKGQVPGVASPGDLSIMVIEKGAEAGSHSISGAILDPKALAELIPDFRDRGAPLESPVGDDDLYYLTRRRALRSPITPPPLRNHGCFIVSLGKLTRWMGEQLEGLGVDLIPGFPGSELLYEDDRVVGVRTGDKGLDREGKPKSNFEPGVDIRAKVTVLGEGARGSLTKQLVARHHLDAGCNPQVYTTGVKEVWEVPEGRLRPGSVVHTLGFPLDAKTFGGGFLYGMADNHISAGFVTDLGYEDPHTDPHSVFQQFKTHPLVARFLEGGRVVSYGAKAIPEGGYWSIPQLYVDGCLIAGDSGSLLNAQRLKGIHTAMKSGMIAADVVAGCLAAGDSSAARLKEYQDRIKSSWMGRELWNVRNFHQAFDGGLWSGLVHSALQMATGGRGVRNRYPTVASHERMRRLRPGEKPPGRAFDGKLTFDKLTDVYFSGTKHEENQPCHLVVADVDICHTRCTEEYGNPCQHFCPASVYEMAETDEGLRLRINASNCVHCKTCDIKDPYGIINWVTPEGGGGPAYVSL